MKNYRAIYEHWEADEYVVLIDTNNNDGGIVGPTLTKKLVDNFYQRDTVTSLCQNHHSLVKRFIREDGN